MARLTKAVESFYQYENEDTKRQLLVIAKEAQSYKNYLYSRFSGVFSLDRLDFRVLRQQLAQEKPENIHFRGLTGHAQQRTLNKAVGNIKSKWSNLFNTIRRKVTSNVTFSDTEKHFIRILLKRPELVYTIFTSISLDELLENPAFSKLDKEQSIRYKKVQQWLKRQIRKHKGKIPYTHKAYELVYSNTLYTSNQEGMKVKGLTKGQRVTLTTLNPEQKTHQREVTIQLLDDRVRVIEPIQTKTKKIAYEEKEIALDKGYRDLLHTDTDGTYGQSYREQILPKLKEIKDISSNRQRFWAKYRKALDDGHTDKAKSILHHNLGRKCIGKKQEKLQNHQKTLINQALNQMILEEKPSKVIYEDLTWSGKKTYSKSMNNELSQWAKGYLQERLDFKAQHYGFETEAVNPAYTSQICHHCQHFGERKGKTFICQNTTCPYYKQEQDSDKNAAKNIKQRSKDPEITVYTPAEKVKEIIEERSKKPVQ